MHKATTGQASFDILIDDRSITVNGEPFSWDIVPIDKTSYHILFNNKSYLAEIIKMDHPGKSCDIRINGKVYTVSLKDRFDLLLEKMGMNNNLKGSVQSIKAPMPGLIIEMRVSDGDVVKKGDPLLVLEAMKMENIIKSPADGKVKMVKVKKGESVEKNQVMIEF